LVRTKAAGRGGSAHYGGTPAGGPRTHSPTRGPIGSAITGPFTLLTRILAHRNVIAAAAPPPRWPVGGPGVAVSCCDSASWRGASPSTSTEDRKGQGQRAGPVAAAVAVRIVLVTADGAGRQRLIGGLARSCRSGVWRERLDGPASPTGWSRRTSNRAARPPRKGCGPARATTPDPALGFGRMAEPTADPENTTRRCPENRSSGVRPAKPAVYAVPRPAKLVGTARRTVGLPCLAGWTMRPGWASGSAGFAAFPFIEPVKPYTQLTLVLLIAGDDAMLRVGGTGTNRIRPARAQGSRVPLRRRLGCFLLDSGWFIAGRKG